MALVGAYRNELWTQAPIREVLGKYHGYLMALDVADRADRTAYFLGRFYDLGTQLFLKKALFEGDAFIDVGANIGMFTLLASRLVGPTGRVVAFEPNPDVYDRLQLHIERNNIGNVMLNAAGLSDVAATSTLTVWANEKGWGTFGTLSVQEEQQVTQKYPCRVAKGDEMLKDLSGAPLTIKMDVEGYECRALRGLAETIRRYKPAIITEVSESNLRRAGTTPHELFSIMARHGYRGYSLGVARDRIRYRLRLRLVAAANDLTEQNVVWLAAGGEHLRRVASMLR